MNRIALTLALAAGISFAAFGYEPQRHNDTFTTNGVTYAQRGGLGAYDYVVTNIDASSVGKVKSVNGKTGAVQLNASDVGALPLVEDVDGEKTAVTIGIRKYSRDVGKGSLANGFNVSASGYYSHAEGDNTTALGSFSHAEGDNTTASGSFSHAEGMETTASGFVSHAEGMETTASGFVSHAAGYMAQTRNVDAYSFAWNGDNTRTNKYESNGLGTFNINPAGGLDGFYIGEQSLAAILTNKADKVAPSNSGNLAALTADGNLADSGKTVDDFLPSEGDVSVDGSITSQSAMNFIFFPRIGVNSSGDYAGIYVSSFSEIKIGSVEFPTGEEPDLQDALDLKADCSMISATNPTFSNAVLAVGLNIDTNAVAILNDIAETFGGFPIEGTATTVGGLLAALAAAIAWLKKNKVSSFESVGGATATVGNGVANLSEFFTKSNSLLNGRLAYSRNETGLKDRAFNALTFDGTEYNLSTALAAVTPTANGQPRDLLIVATATAATTISFTAGTIKGDKPTIDGAGTWLITLTEYAANTWYCRQIKMEDAA